MVRTPYRAGFWGEVRLGHLTWLAHLTGVRLG